MWTPFFFLGEKESCEAHTEEGAKKARTVATFVDKPSQGKGGGGWAARTG